MSMTRANELLPILISFFAGSAALAAEPDRGAWSQWRGPGGSGIAAPADVPLEWDATSGRNIQWKTEIEGRGHSSPVVWGDRIFLTTAVEGEVIPGAKAPPHMMEGEEFKHPYALGADRRHTLKVIATSTATTAPSPGRRSPTTGRCTTTGTRRVRLLHQPSRPTANTSSPTS